ncbi:MAG TPA: helix-turn-helix transcriptional regulator [Micromonosporaceae bacterium]|nr:helix-turn-helix transcriptional regulator [Micromonosporaceae bacterium]
MDEQDAIDVRSLHPVGLGYALHAAGQLHEAREVADRGYAAAVAVQASALAGWWAGFKGVIAKAQGRLSDAKTSLREAVVLKEYGDPAQSAQIWLAELAGANALCGDGVAARHWLSRADAYEVTADQPMDAWVELDRAWVVSVLDSPRAGVETARNAAKMAHENEQPAFEAIALYDMARLGAASAIWRRLDKLAHDTNGGFAAILARSAAALATGDGQALERSAASFADHGHLLLAAEAAAAAARAFQRIGQGVRSRIAVERAAALVGLCQGAHTPLLHLDGFHAVLTYREREIATMAINLTSRRIADRLGLSIHTVNNTLARAYAKLGVTNRRDLAAFFGGAARQAS